MNGRSESLGLAPALLGALITEIGIPELTRWLAGLHAAGKVVTEAAALEKLGVDVDGGNALGVSFLASHPGP